MSPSLPSIRIMQKERISVFFIIFCVVLLPFAGRAHYLNPDTGRFWSLDSHEGDNDDPKSLHKYLYCGANPINGIDPSGNDELAMTLSTTTIMSGLAAFTGAVLLEAKTHAIRDLTRAVATEAINSGASLIETARSALRAAGKTVRDLIEEAKMQIGQLRNSPVKVIPIPRSIIPDVANHIANAQSLGYPGLPIPLTRCSPTQANIHRADAIKGLGSAFPNSWDEYPFASSWQGGSFTSVSPVPLWQNCVQGGIISACYAIEKITYAPPTPYFVVVIP